MTNRPDQVAAGDARQYDAQIAQAKRSIQALDSIAGDTAGLRNQQRQLLLNNAAAHVYDTQLRHTPKQV
ncbi:hypothetical protein MKK55_17895, partial [Methylobacterium sp. J-059]|uniref:hypothetical protein n=1 Tax=Methylobacterium sp. J-059 TaxID=2836643 RepID=UPI001FBA7A11